MGILTLNDEELSTIVNGDMLDVRCDACGTHYGIEPSAVRAMRELRDRGAQPS